MTVSDESDVPEEIAAAFARHDAFEPTDESGTYALETTAFDVTVSASPVDSERAGAFTVRVPVPTLSASVADPDDVAPVVEDGWFETFERRLEDAFDVAKTSYGDDPEIDRGVDQLDVALSFEAWSATDGVDDAKAVAEYVEGTFVQGLIPGYDYVGAAAELRGAASANAQSATDTPSGTNATDEDGGGDGTEERQGSGSRTEHSDRSGTPL